MDCSFPSGVVTNFRCDFVFQSADMPFEVVAAQLSVYLTASRSGFVYVTVEEADNIDQCIITSKATQLCDGGGEGSYYGIDQVEEDVAGSIGTLGYVHVKVVYNQNVNRGKKQHVNERGIGFSNGDDGDENSAKEMMDPLSGKTDKTGLRSKQEEEVVVTCPDLDLNMFDESTTLATFRVKLRVSNQAFSLTPSPSPSPNFVQKREKERIEGQWQQMMKVDCDNATAIFQAQYVSGGCTYLARTAYSYCITTGCFGALDDYMSCTSDVEWSDLYDTVSVVCSGE